MKIRTHLGIWLCILILPFLPVKAQNSMYIKYIEKYKHMAIDQMNRHGIPASITLAQGLLESAAGTSSLATEANNHFGIKCHTGWKGKYVRRDDDAKGEKFRVYNSVSESYEDHSLFLKKQRYASLFKLKKTDYKGWAHGLKRCGYATNPKYAYLLIDLIERFNLDQYDKGTTPKSQPKKRKSQTNVPKKHTVHMCNKNYYVIVQKGDTWKSISKEMGVSVRKLRKYNEVDKKHVISAGDIIYLEKKQKKAAKQLKGHVHRVKSGESLYSISQMYGMRIKTLYKLNKLPDNYRVQAGDLLKIR